MARYWLSSKAADDIGQIANYTIECHGIGQARHYRDTMTVCFEFLGENPGVGRKIDDILAGYRCFHHQSRVVFYTVDGPDILIVRVLHNRMDVTQHLYSAILNGLISFERRRVTA